MTRESFLNLMYVHINNQSRNVLKTKSVLMSQ